MRTDRWNREREPWMTKAGYNACANDGHQLVFPNCGSCKNCGGSSFFVGFCYVSKKVLGSKAPKFKKVGWFKKIENKCEHFENG